MQNPFNISQKGYNDSHAKPHTYLITGTISGQIPN